MSLAGWWWRMVDKATAVKTAPVVEGSLALKPVEIPAIPIEKVPVLSLSLDRFARITSDVVIPAFEGGYYHPAMKQNFKASDQAKLGDSGETLFGLDRKHGAQLARYPEWKTFWELTDQDRKLNPGIWKYNYKPAGELGRRLRWLASSIMFKWFSYLAGKYILVGAMDEIAADERLIIHFSYASWNGEGWFKRYAEALNKALQKHDGLANEKELIYKDTIKARTESSNKVIRQQGANMIALFKKLKLI